MLIPYPSSSGGSTQWEEGRAIDQEGILVGSNITADVRLSDVGVADRHAKLYKAPAATDAPQGSYHIVSFAPGETFINGELLVHGQRRALRSGDIVHFGRETNEAVKFKIKLRHFSTRNGQQPDAPESKKEAVLNG